MRAFFMAITAAMKKVLSPISDTAMTPKLLTSASHALACRKLLRGAIAPSLNDPS
jgi:hypothetical protein